MLRTSLRNQGRVSTIPDDRLFLSSNAQDFIEDHEVEYRHPTGYCIFLSSNAQDFIEDRPTVWEPLKSFDS